jgi:head-tail adaptor
MRSAGQRDKLVTLQRATTSRDDHNEESSTWGAIGQEYASVIFGRGDERRSAAQTQAAQSVT